MQLDGFAFLVGIDLGTTNSAVSYIDLRKNSKEIKTFLIPQLTEAGVFSKDSVLPSFIYIPGSHELDLKSIDHPWPKSDDSFAGVFARDFGSKVPSRLISSAKSWLCHEDLDKKAAVLPWGSPSEIKKISPVRATATYLSHIRNAWNMQYVNDGDLHLEHQKITITIPASFDEVAREMTLEAAKEAGLLKVTLLEEPLAAFYAWLSKHEKDWQNYINPDELILVCDMGGGTSDFTLICLREDKDGGSPRFERLAVGDHLILGGDNIDLALTRLVEAKLKEKNISLEQDRWKTLSFLCRGAKEKLLAGQSEKERIILVGEGQKLIGGSISSMLEKKELEDILLDGFFPLLTPADFNYKQAVAGGVSEFGLPYAMDPALTRHIANFLYLHAEEVEEKIKRKLKPDHVLFNGGTLKPALLRKRICHAISGLFDLPEEEGPRELENFSYDLAVSFGATYYGLVKSGLGVKVGSGSPRSYYIGLAVEGEKKALCLVERGLDEGSDIELPEFRFEVQANEPVQFDLYSSSFRSGDKAGDIIEIDKSLSSLPALKTLIRFGKREEARSIPVHMLASYTELGTISLWCRSAVSDHRWQLSFHLRQQPLSVIPENSSVIDADRVDTAVCAALISLEDAESLDNPVREISALVLLSKNQWPLDLLRKISDALLSEEKLRHTSPLHETRWLNLLGFCLRPGIGDAFDEERLRRLWRIYRNGPVFSNKPQNKNEWWILWRRVAAGLSPGRQRQILQDISPLIFPKGKNQRIDFSHEILEIWALVANLELLSIQDKLRCAKALFPALSLRKTPERIFWVFSRLCSRSLLYGSADKVIPPDIILPWLEAISEISWLSPENKAAILLPMSRMTGDRVRDLPLDFRNGIFEELEKALDSEKHKSLNCLKSVLPIEQEEEKEMFGEALPPGLKLYLDD